MTKRETYEQKTEQLLLPIMEEHQFELVDVEFVKEAGNWFLRAYIDKPGGIGVDDCETVSRRLSDLLDEQDFIEESYILEVSSPGLDRILKRDREYVKYKGRMVDVKLYEAINKQKHLTAELVEKTADELILDDEGTRLAINLKNVAQVRLAIMF